MPIRYPLTVEASLDELIAGNNLYIYRCLRKIAEEKITEIDELCRQYYDEDEIIEKVQLAYLAELSQINYLVGYVTNKIKPKRNGGLYLCEDSMEKFIYDNNESLIDIDKFVYIQLSGLHNHSNDLLNKIDNVRNTIEKYSRANKQHMITEFRSDLAKLTSKVIARPYHLIADQVNTDLNNILDKLQTNENQYYAGLRFFSSRRKSHSTLQPQIDKARALL